MKNFAVKKHAGKSGRAIWQTLVGAALGFGIAVVMIPHYSAAKRKAEAVAGYQNLRQWGIALNLHLADNVGHLPELGTEAVNASQTNAWYNSLPQYLGLPALADIPAGSRPRPGDGSIWFAPNSTPRNDLSREAYFFGYGMNKFLQTRESGPTTRVTALPHASQIVFLTPNESSVPWTDPQHLASTEGLSSVLFCDGHVELIGSESPAE